MKRNRGWMGYLVVLVTFLLIAITLGGSLGQKDRTVTYPQLLEMIRKDEVSAVAIRNTSLVGLRRDTKVKPDAFPDQNYDFETTIGEDFIETVRQMEATRRGVALDAISVSDLPFSVQYRAPVTIPWWYEFIPLLIMIVLMGGLWFFIMRSQGGGNGKVMNFGKSRARVSEPGKNKITFDDVAGADEEKEELQEMVDFLRNPKTYIDMGARIPKGVLLVGPPGKGKTLLATAVAGEAGVPFFSISGSDFVEMFVGVGASRVRDLFDQAKRSAPAIVFIDEIDAVGRHRGAGLGGGHDEREQTLNQLLVEMDGFESNQGVIVMAATNRRDILDPALLRPGRFDRTITVNYPDLEGRVAILKVHTKGKPLAADVDLENIAKRTPYATGAELENMMNEAAILAARARKTEIDHKIMVDAISRVQMGPEKRSHKVTDRDRRIVAIHEAGHAIVSHCHPNGDPVHLVTIVPRGQAAGHTLSLPEQEIDMQTTSTLKATMAMLMGGHAAEMVGLGEFSAGATSDLERATNIARRMVTQFGMSDKVGPVCLDDDQEVFVGNTYGRSSSYSANTAAVIDEEVKGLCDGCYQEALRILTENRDKLDLLTEALLKHQTLSRKEFVTLMDTGVMPEITAEDKPRTVQEILQQEQPAAPEKENITNVGKVNGIRVGTAHEDPQA